MKSEAPALASPTQKADRAGYTDSQQVIAQLG